MSPAVNHEVVDSSLSDSTTATEIFCPSSAKNKYYYYYYYA